MKQDITESNRVKYMRVYIEICRKCGDNECFYDENRRYQNGYTKECEKQINRI